MTKKAKVFGWYGHSNIGDESYKLSIPKLFPDIDFQFSDLALKSEGCDNLILGGGDILYPHYVDQLLNTPAKHRAILSVSANPQVSADALRRVDQIFVRDHRSVQLLQSQGVNCTWMPDVSTGLEPNPAQGLAWLQSQYQKNNLELYSKRIGIVFNAHLYRSEETLARDFLTLMKSVWDLGKLCDNTCASFIFFPMSTQMPYDDRNTNSMISARCKFWRKNLMIYDRLGVQETLDVISACDMVISTRLHSTIFSLISQVPILDLTHHDKNKSYLATANLANCSLSYWNLDYDTLKRTVEDMLANKEKYVELLKPIKDHHVKVLNEESQKMYFV